MPIIDQFYRKNIMSEKNRSILIISQHFPPEKSGNASRIHDMAFHLTQSGVSVNVMSPFPSYPHGYFPRVWHYLSNSTKDGIEFANIWTWQPVSNNPNFISRMAYYLIFPINVTMWLILNQKKFDIIITSSPPLFTHIPGIFFKVIYRKIWVMDIRDLWIDASISLGFLKKRSIFERMSRFFEKKCLLSSDMICVTTTELGKRLPVQDIIKKKITLIPNGVDISVFVPTYSAKKNQVIYAGNIGYAQDLESVILAIKQIVKKYPIKLIIAGDGEILPKLKKLVITEGLENWVHFPGVLPRESIPQLISESLIGLAPLKKLAALEYAAPTKVYEYMACEIPFLGCGDGEIMNIAKDSGAGIIADNSTDSIAAAILHLLENPTLRADMGKKGRIYVKESYDRNMIALKLRKILTEIS